MSAEESKAQPPEASHEHDTVNHAKDSASLKRAREGSQEPTPSPNPVPIAPPKRNRLETTSEESTHGSDAETGKVGEVRRKVQEMTWKEGSGPGASASAAGGEQPWEELKDEEVAEAKAMAKDDTQEQEQEPASGTELKRKPLERNASSVLESSEPAKKAKDVSSPPSAVTSPSQAEPAPAPASAPTPAKKPQSTFGAFSSSASPFASARTASPFASPFASASASASSSTTTPATAGASKPLSTGSAFGNYSSSFSAFAKKPPTVPAPTPTAPNKEEEDKTGGPSGSSFGDILKESKADEGETADKVHMTEKDVYTGEEDEETLYQCRAKLYVMQADGGWKERGVGALRLNVRAGDGKGARLVMRAEGVLRLILNVSLYVGMACLEDGKHVRSTVFEDNEKRFITFRLGTQKAAAELCANIQENIPLESTKSPGPDAPSPSPALVAKGQGEEAV